jgi:hypothetical protein
VHGKALLATFRATERWSHGHVARLLAKETLQHGWSMTKSLLNVAGKRVRSKLALFRGPTTRSALG